MSLKIKPEHFEKLKVAVNEVLANLPEGTQNSYKAQGLSNMRFNWDVFYSTRIEGMTGNEWLCHELYPYLNDSHMNSALAVIIGNDGTNSKGTKR